jgi:hypothetical protein
MREFSFQELDYLSGGGWAEAIDVGCATFGVASLFIPGGQSVTAFCAGWGLGRIIGSALSS